MISDMLTLQLAPDFSDDVIVKFQEFVAKDKDHLLKQEGQDLTLKVRSVNQVREDRNLSGVEWGELPVGTPGDVPYDGSDPIPEPAAPRADANDDKLRVNALRSIFALQKREITNDLLEKGRLDLVQADWTPIFKLRMPWMSEDQAYEIHQDTVEQIQRQFLLATENHENREKFATRIRKVFNERRRDAARLI
jgi:hypothetical protein